MKKFLYAVLVLHASSLAFSNNATKLPANMGDISSLLKDYSAIKIDATAEFAVLGDNMSEIKKTTSKLTAQSSLRDNSCAINWHPEETIVYKQNPPDSKNLLPDSILSRNSLYISKNNKIKTYYFNEGPQTNLKINNELLIREFNKGIDSFIATFYTGKIFFPNFAELCPNSKNGYYSVADILQIKPKDLNLPNFTNKPPVITQNGDIIHISFGTEATAIRCELNAVDMHIRYIETLYKHSSGKPSLLVRFDYSDSISPSNRNFSLPRTVTRTLYSNDNKRGNRYKLTLNSIKLLDKFDPDKSEPALTKGWCVTDMIKKTTYTIAEVKDDTSFMPTSDKP